MIRVKRFWDVAEFYALAEPMLMQHEAENNFMLGLAAGLRKKPPAPENLYVIVFDGDVIIAAATMTPPWPLGVTRGPEAAMIALAEYLCEHKLSVAEFCGPTIAAEQCAQSMAKRVGWRVQLRDRMRIFQLTRVIPPRPIPGSMRVADEHDEKLVLDWMAAFGREIEEMHEIPRERILERIALKQFHLWEDPLPVSIAGWTGRTPNGVRINAVYTPPQMRGRGCASNVVAELTQKMLDDGRKFCFLYTDATNPTSNKIYQQIGYEFVCEWANLKLVPE